MAVETYLGFPPPDIKQWILDNAQPSGKAETRITFSDSTVEEYNWSGEINQQTMIDAGLFDTNTWTWTNTLEQVEIGSNVTSIGNYAFAECSGLRIVKIPYRVTNIGEGAFSDCSGLNVVTFQGGVEDIGPDAFSYCTSLTSVTIPDSVTSIGQHAFYGCSDLTSVVFQGKSLAQVQAMNNYSWGIEDTSIITVG